jgi:DNA-binding HxlR family transcriptional regulator
MQNDPIAGASDGSHEAESLAYCPLFQHVMELLGRRWSGVILRELLNGTNRFSDLKRAVPGLTDRLLADRLHEFEVEGLLSKEYDAGVLLYTLTDRGLDLREIVGAVSDHAARWSSTCHLADRPGRRAGA